MFEFPSYFRKNYDYEKISLFNVNANVFQTFCIFFYAFGNHPIFLTVTDEMNNKENNSINKLAKYSFNLQLILFIGVMFIGYFSTFDQTEDIYINRADQSIFMVIGKAFFIILLLCNIGLYYYMNRSDFEACITAENTKVTNNKRVICSIIVLSTLLLISLEFDNVVLLLSFIGGTGNVYIIFIVPVLLYIKSYRPESTYLYYTFMIVVTFIGASNTILSVINYFIKVFI